MVAQGSSRVPAALQNIFLQSQRGEDVEKIAPPPKLGFKIFYRGSKKEKLPKKLVQAPDLNSLYMERSDGKETAATASRRAIKARGGSSDDGSMSVSIFFEHAFTQRFLG
jgi:hypothetical protein